MSGVDYLFPNNYMNPYIPWTFVNQ
jgi:hypothetical protein